MFMRVEALQDTELKINDQVVKIKKGDVIDLGEFYRWVNGGFVIPVRKKKLEKQITLAAEKAVTR